MPPVFAHGRLRLYLLKLLDEAPRHGYEIIRLLEERFQGLYAPSAGTVYPRLAKLEAEGLVSHATEGGRKVYSITAEGRSELADRQSELVALEQEIHESLTALAADIRADVRDTADELRREMFQAAERSHEHAGPPPSGSGSGADSSAGTDGDTSGTGAWDGGWMHAPWGDQEAWQRAKEELRQAKHEWQKQARRARSDSRRAREKAQEAQAAAEQARHKAQRQAQREAQRAAQEEVGRIARNVQEQVQRHAQTGDWQGAVREGMAELAKEMGSLGRLTGSATAWPPFTSDEGAAAGEGGASARKPTATEEERGTTSSQADPVEGELPEWAHEPAQPSTDPARELHRLLDRFRDDVRDAARDNGVTDEQLRDIRRHLSTAAAHIGVRLRPGSE